MCRGSGGSHFGPFEIELRPFQDRFERRHRTCSIALHRLPRFKFPLGQRLALGQRCRPLDVGGRNLQPGPCALHLGFGLLDRNLVGPRINDEQKIALLDELTVFEMDRTDEPRHTGTDFDCLYGYESAGVFIPLRNILLQRSRHSDRRRGL
jgi:hypothetical protein